MSQVHPVVRYLILCEDVQTDPETPPRATLFRILSTLRSPRTPPFPFVQEHMCAFLHLTECRGPAEGNIEIHHADTDQIVFRTQKWTMPLGNDPLAVVGVTFRLRNCLFPVPGLYWVQFWYNQEMIAQQSLLVR
jgi:hypothetical protein